MPVYEYACSSCGGRFEAVQKFSDPAPSACTLCGAVAIQKVLSAPAFVLKGSGWYATDYPSADRKKAMECEKPSAAASEGCGSGACGSGGCTTSKS